MHLTSFDMGPGTACGEGSGNAAWYGCSSEAFASPVGGWLIESHKLGWAGRSLLLSPTSDVMLHFFASSSGSWVAGAGRLSIFVLFLLGDLIVCLYLLPVFLEVYRFR